MDHYNFISGTVKGNLREPKGNHRAHRVTEELRGDLSGTTVVTLGEC